MRFKHSLALVFSWCYSPGCSVTLCSSHRLLFKIHTPIHLMLGNTSVWKYVLQFEIEWKIYGILDFNCHLRITSFSSFIHLHHLPVFAWVLYCSVYDVTHLIPCCAGFFVIIFVVPILTEISFSERIKVVVRWGRTFLKHRY